MSAIYLKDNIPIYYFLKYFALISMNNETSVCIIAFNASLVISSVSDTIEFLHSLMQNT